MEIVRSAFGREARQWNAVPTKNNGEVRHERDVTGEAQAASFWRRGPAGATVPHPSSAGTIGATTGI
jgi:hypothetical protein